VCGAGGVILILCIRFPNTISRPDVDAIRLQLHYSTSQLIRPVLIPSNDKLSYLTANSLILLIRQDRLRSIAKFVTNNSLILFHSTNCGRAIVLLAYLSHCYSTAWDRLYKKTAAARVGPTASVDFQPRKGISQSDYTVIHAIMTLLY